MRSTSYREAVGNIHSPSEEKKVEGLNPSVVPWAIRISTC